MAPIPEPHALSLLLSKERPIAYFCAEYAIDDLLPIYAGGLGILAGDIVLEAQDMEVPLVAIGLFYRRGFLTYPQRDNDQKPTNPESSGFTLVRDATGNVLVMGVSIGDREVYFQAWTKSWGSARMYLLDPHVAENKNESDKNSTAYLYPDNFEERITQEMVLGVGGVALLKALAITPSIYHLQEGHTSFAALGLILEEMKETKSFTKALDTVRTMIVGTKHTILPGAGIFFTKEQSTKYLGKLFGEYGVNHDDFFSLGVQADNTEVFSTTQFLLRSSIRVSAVSNLHAAFEKKACPTCKELIPITNGISKRRWMLPALSSPLSDENLWQEHMKAKQELALHVKKITGKTIDPEALTIVWARRIAEYKRPLLLFEDMKRLANIVSNVDRPVTVIISGNAYGWDFVAVKLLEELLGTIQNLNQKSVLYLPGYSIGLSKKLVSAADIWLNTPKVGKEASGTSGMKASINGALQISVGDGWFAEVAGEDPFWTLSADHTAESLYTMLEQEVIPTYYTRDSEGYPRQWISRMKKTRATILQQYTTRRMLEEYIQKLYFPSA